jgi:hypothetical protein
MRIEQNRAVHLSGEADAADCLSARTELRKGLRDGATACFPPIARVLLGPADLRRLKGNVIRRSRCEHFSALVNDKGARSACTDVDS